jgi:hypothetical protein
MLNNIPAKERIFLWLKISLFYLVLIALIGAYLRLKFVVPVPVFQYEYILHTHSHTAMLGWVYSALYIALLLSFIPDAFNKKSYVVLFWLTQFAILGILVTFTVHGYWFLSIAFSTLHIFLSYWFILKFVKDVMKDRTVKGGIALSLKFIYASLFLLFLSSFGPWGLAVLAANKMIGTDLYNDAIYFYLHFQYDGWFTFAVIGLFIRYIESLQVMLNFKNGTRAFWFLFAGVIPAYILSLPEQQVPSYMWLIGVIAGIVQFIGAILLLKLLAPHVKAIAQNTNRVLVYVFIFSLALKFFLQILSAVPYLNNLIFNNRDVIIGYIHLVMLGVVTCGLFAWLYKQGLLNMKSRVSKTGLALFIIGFIITEILLFAEMLIFWIDISFIPFRMLLFIFSIFLLGGVLIIWLDQLLVKDFKAP